jgi:hypothetical protein
MSSFHAPAAMAPLVRYDDRYARAIGRWILDAASAARLFYQDGLPRGHQSFPDWRSDPPGAVSHEGLRKWAVVLAGPAGERTVRGRIVRGTFAEAGPADGEEVLAADVEGRLEHIWEIDLGGDSTWGWLLIDGRSGVPPEKIGVSWAIAAEGPIRPLGAGRRPDGGDDGRFRIEGAPEPPAGAARLHVKIECAGAAPGAEVAVEKLRCRLRKSVSPYATGDPIVHEWGPRTDLGIYGASHVGYLAALIDRTEREHILRIDLLATDFFRGPAYPTYLYYNPYPGAAKVGIDVGPEPRDLYEATGSRFAAKGVRGRAEITVPGDGAAVIVVAPAGGRVERRGATTAIDGVPVDFTE